MNANLLNTLPKLLLICLLTIIPYHSDAQDTLTGSTKSIKMEIDDGLGPRGLSAITMSKVKDADTLHQKMLGVYDVDSYDELEQLEEYYFIINRSQFYFQNYKAGKISKHAFSELMQEHDLKLQDTSKLSPVSINIAIRILLGKKKGVDEHVFIVDANQNGSYGDDMSQIVPSITAINNGTVKPVPLSMDFLNENMISHEKVNFVCYISKDYFFLSLHSLQLARFSIDNSPYIACKDLIWQDEVYILPDKPYFTNIPRTRGVQNGESIILKGQQFNVAFMKQSLSLNLTPSTPNDAINIVVSKKRLYHDEIRNVSVKATNLEGHDIMSSEKKAIADNTGNWTLLYFWGDFCAPCIESLPKINALQEKYQHTNFKIFGVIDVRNKVRTEKMLKDYDIKWSNIRLTKLDLDNSSYQVHGFPTTYLINPEGNIERRLFTIDQLQDILPTLLPDSRK